ncbi:MAG: hypothetical protein ABL996_02070 [Micropepsaceae bacterium]
MNKKEVAAVGVRVSRAFAAEIGYSAGSKGRYVQQFGHYNRLFWLEPSVTYGVGELTLNIGVEVPALDEVVRLFPGLEKGDYPIFGGPIFRFADLMRSNLHDFIIKVASPDCDELILAQLEQLWRQVAMGVFQKLSTPDGWLESVDTFLKTNKTGALKIPTMGRVCVALKHSMEGREQAEGVVKVLSEGPEGRRVQDREQAIKLQRLLTDNSEVLSNLRKAILQTH